VRKGQLIDLRFDRLAHLWVIVTKARNSRATTGIQIAPPRFINQVISISAHDYRKVGMKVPVENAAI
jgi:hypothetical protein